MQIAAMSDNDLLPISGNMQTYLRRCAIMIGLKANVGLVNLNGFVADAGPGPSKLPVIFWQKNLYAVIYPGHR